MGFIRVTCGRTRREKDKKSTENGKKRETERLTAKYSKYAKREKDDASEKPLKRFIPPALAVHPDESG